MITPLAACKRLPAPPSVTAGRVAPPPPDASKADRILPAVDIYADDSQSMLGFVNVKSSEYRRVVGSLFEQLLATGYRFSITRLTDVQGTAAGAVTSGDLFTERFYDKAESPLATLLATVAERKDAPESKDGTETKDDPRAKDGPKAKASPTVRDDSRAKAKDRPTARDGFAPKDDRKSTDRVLVVISDMVQSEKHLAQHDFVGAFRKAAATRPNVLLVGFRSAFSGTYWVETVPKSVHSHALKLDGKLPESSRPFYILVFAPSPSSLDDFKRYVLDQLPRNIFPGATQSLRATDAPVGITDVSFVADGSFGTYLARESLGQNVASGSSGYLWTLVERRVPNRDVTDLRLRVDGTSTLPIESLGRLDYEVVRRGAKPDEWLPAAVPIGVDGGVPPTPMPGDGKSRSFVLLHQFPRTQRYTWDVYRIRVRPGRANVVAPAWVADWTTRDDGDRSHGHRTLNLHLLVAAMLRGITEDIVLTEHYLRLGRE